MTFYQIPLSGALPFQTFRISLSGVQFQLTLRFNGRMNRWIMEIDDTGGNAIIYGIPLLIQRNLLGQFATLALPEGTMFVTDDSGQDAQPTQYSFDTDHTLRYADPTS